MCWTYLHQRDLWCTGCVWTTGACAAPGRVYTTGSWVAPVHVWTTGACAAPGRATPQGPELHLDIPGQEEPLLLFYLSTLQWPELDLDVPRLQEPDPEFGNTTEACAAPGSAYTTPAWAVFGRVWNQNPSCTGLDVSTQQGASAATGRDTLQRPMLHLDVSTPPGLELHQDTSAPQRPVLHLDVTSPLGLVLSLDLSEQQSLRCLWTCLHYRYLWCN